jgi:hypothetical protein
VAGLIAVGRGRQVMAVKACSMQRQEADVRPQP